MMIKKNEVLLFGKIVSIPEFRSETKDGDELHQCLVEVPVKTVHSGMIKELGKSYITLIYKINKSADRIDDQRIEEKAWLSLKSGEFVEVKGQLAQDRIGRLGTSSVFIRSFKVLERLDESQGNAIVTITGEIYKNSPVIKQFPNKAEKLTFLLNQTDGESSMKTYVVAWNNLAHKIQEFDLIPGDQVEVLGNLVSRKYHDRSTEQDVNVCELLARRVNFVERIDRELVSAVECNKIEVDKDVQE